LRSGAKKLKTIKTKPTSSKSIITEPDLGEQSDVISENIYESLEDDVDDSEDEYQTHGRRKKPVKKSQNATKSGSTQKPKNSEGPKPPPITVTNINIRELGEKLKPFVIGKDNIKIQLSSIGIKIFVSTENEFVRLKKFCDDIKIEYFTHALKSEKLNKIVLYGLPEMEIAELKGELNNLKLFPVDIKKLLIKEPKYDIQCHYLLYFKKADKIKISDLREIRSLFQIIVKWANYVHRRRGPTQCSNCQAFSHGTRNCFLKPKCIRCSQEHKSSDCPLVDKTKPEAKTPREKLKCANCNGHHVASYTRCPRRMEIIQAREAVKRRNTNFHSSTFQPAPQLDNTNFPSIIQNANSNSAWTNRNQGPSNHFLTSNNTNETLFTPSECFTIFNEFISALSQCRSKIDQLKVISEITFKYMPK
jgi:transposase